MPHSKFVVDTRHSPYAHLRPVPLDAVTLRDEFWSPRMRINREVTLPSQYAQLEQSGTLDNFRRAAGKINAPFRGRLFTDTDAYKWLEAIAWTLAAEPDPALAKMADTVIAEIGDSQRADGYLDSFYARETANDRWTNLRDNHEMYCAGHLFQAAVAHARATGSERLLNIARRFADHICNTFGAMPGKRASVDGHPEVEMGLIELARVTGERKYLEQTQFFIDVRGRGVIGGNDYHQDRTPLREQSRMVGHAVRATYLNIGATDLYAETGDAPLRAALERMWQSLTERQMYITGGIGSRHKGEAFGADYELPNSRAYTETCAAIALVMWAWRMLALDGDARYADVMETALYNGVLSGVSFSGQEYFYENPLANDGSHRREPWYECACCPPNVARTFASLPGYFYSTRQNEVFVHLYAENNARSVLADGRTVGVTQHTRYPWDGQVNLAIDAEGELGLHLRVPGWCESGATIAINGKAYDGALVPGSYAAIRREWRNGDVVTLNLPMPARRVQSHPYAIENKDHIALTRGPLVYCIEGADNPGIDLRDVVVSAKADITATFRAVVLNGVTQLEFPARLAPPDPGWTNRLHRTARDEQAQPSRSIRVTAIPYYAWANRAPGAMRVWLKSE
ncbi:MAG: glycoside hydrolase family 127 protein [Chloroflexi bacterium]|nr:glycoside hydrolase family 127 protein [Chloroflexota bacterium]